MFNRVRQNQSFILNHCFILPVYVLLHFVSGLLFSILLTSHEERAGPTFCLSCLCKMSSCQEGCELLMGHVTTCLSRVWTRLDSNRPAKLQRLARVLKAWIIASIGMVRYYTIYPRSEQQRRWSDCAYAQADLRLCRSHMAKTGFLRHVSNFVILAGLLYLLIRFFLCGLTLLCGILCNIQT